MRAPGIFAGAWSVIRGFIDPVTAAKVSFVPWEAEAEMRALAEVGATAVMPPAYGGTNESDVPVPNIPGEPNLDGAPGLRLRNEAS